MTVTREELTAERWAVVRYRDRTIAHRSLGAPGTELHVTVAKEAPETWRWNGIDRARANGIGGSLRVAKGYATTLAAAQAAAIDWLVGYANREVTP